jgi:hypothetical protein
MDSEHLGQMRKEDYADFGHRIEKIQRPLDQPNPRAENHQNVPADGQAITVASSTIAEALIPRVTQVVSGALAEAARTGVRAGDQIMEIVARHGLRWALPPEFFPKIQMFVTSYCDLVAQQKSKIEEFLRRFAPAERPSICYEVYQHGRTDYYFDRLFEDAIRLRETALFWINRSGNELLSRGERRIRSEWLPPRAEEMLRFLCRTENAGQIISFSELFLEVWKPTTPPSKYQMCDSINVMKSTINAFAGEQFIKTVSNKSEQDDKRVLRIRGCNEFRVGREVSAELIIIKKIAP